MSTLFIGLATTKFSLQVMILCRDGQAVEFSIDREMPLAGMFTQYCALKRVYPGYVSFWHGGKRLDERVDADTSQLANGSIIAAVSVAY